MGLGVDPEAAVTAELTSPTVVAAWLRAAVEAPEGAAWLVSWV